MKKLSARSLALTAAVTLAATPLLASVTCPAKLYDNFSGREWTLTTVEVKEGDSISFFGVTLYESETTMIGTYKTASGDTVRVDCSGS